MTARQLIEFMCGAIARGWGDYAVYRITSQGYEKLLWGDLVLLSEEEEKKIVDSRQRSGIIGVEVRDVAS